MLGCFGLASKSGLSELGFLFRAHPYRLGCRYCLREVFRFITMLFSYVMEVCVFVHLLQGVDFPTEVNSIHGKFAPPHEFFMAHLFKRSKMPTVFAALFPAVSVSKIKL